MIDWLTGWWHKLVQSVVWRSFFSQFHWLDWVLLAILVIGLVYGIKKGFWSTLFDVFGNLLIILFTFRYVDIVGGWIAHYLSFLPLAIIPVLAYTCWLVLVWLVTSWIVKRLKKMFTAKTSPLIRILGGAILGGTYFFLTASILCQGILLSPWPGAKEVFNKKTSVSGYYLANAVPEIYMGIITPVRFISQQIRKIQP